MGEATHCIQPPHWCAGRQGLENTRNEIDGLLGRPGVGQPLAAAVVDLVLEIPRPGAAYIADESRVLGKCREAQAGLGAFMFGEIAITGLMLDSAGFCALLLHGCGNGVASCVVSRCLLAQQPAVLLSDAGRWQQGGGGRSVKGSSPFCVGLPVPGSWSDAAVGEVKRQIGQTCGVRRGRIPPPVR